MKKNLLKKINIQSIVSSISKYEIIFLFILRMIFDILYITIISKNYQYTGLELNFSLLKYALSLIIFIILLHLFKRGNEYQSFSNYICRFIFILYFIPMTTLFGLNNFSYAYIFFSSVYMLFFVFLNNYIKYFNFRFFKKNMSSFFLYTISAVSFVLVFYIWSRYTNYRLIIRLSDIYEIRAITSTYNINKIILYCISFINIIVPFILAISIKNKKYISCIISIITQYLLFVFDPQKSIILCIVVILLCMFFYKNNYEKTLSTILIFAFVCGLIEFGLIDSINIFSYIFRRISILPSFLSYRYFVFFSENGIDFFTNGPLRLLGFSQIYPVSIPVIVGHYYGTAFTSFNNGLIGDAFVNLGYFGAIIMPVLLIFTFRLFDMCSSNHDRRIVFSFSILYFIRFSNSLWSTVLLTGGFLIICLMFLLFNVDSNNKTLIINDKDIYHFQKNKFDVSKTIYISLIVILTGAVSYVYPLFFNHKSQDNVEYKTIKYSGNNSIEKSIYYYNNYKQLKYINEIINSFIVKNNLEMYYDQLEILNMKTESILSHNYNYNFFEIDNVIEPIWYEQEKLDEDYKYLKVVNLEDVYNSIDDVYIIINNMSIDINKIDNINVSYDIEKNKVLNYRIYYYRNDISVKQQQIISFIVFESVVLLICNYFVWKEKIYEI